ncbi:MAG TPA: septum formation family protein [Candidatus Limnocylindrales bacterium]|nr:septum formation family protein [Candidatus Limnocylindrales bacterium]
MPERWTCGRCSTANESWAITCSGCGSLRADLSVAGSGVDPAPATEPPQPPPAAAPEPTIAPPEGKAEALLRAAPAWGGKIASSGLVREPAESGTPVAIAESASAPPAKVPIWRRLPLGVIVAIGFVAIGAVGGLIFNASRSDSGEITKSGNLDVLDLRVGDCFDLKDPEAEEIGEVTALPCTSEHEYEMYFIGSMPSGVFPTDDGFGAWLDANCLPAFEEYVGMSYDDSELEIFWLAPSEEAWNDGDRSIQCALEHPRIRRLTQSLRDSAQ